MVVVVVVGSMVESPEVWLPLMLPPPQVYSHRGESPPLAELAALTNSSMLKYWQKITPKIQLSKSF